MRVAPATFVTTRARRPLHKAELMLRYGSAYGCMLVALAAAQLVSNNVFVLLLTGITIIGLPLSLTLRQLMESSARWRSYRFFINSLVVIGSAACSILYIVFSHPELLTPAFMKVLVVDYGVADSIKVLMELFLIFSTFRAVAITSDREAVLSAVPSFSALLLLMVIHRGPQVVFYFAVWTILAAVLFALDHRAESSGKVHGRISAMKAGQEVRLSARSLATVLGFSLVIALGIAYTLSTRNPEDRSQLERWVMGMASGMTKLALNLPDISINNGPERQIDFTAGPALPTRTELWRVGAITFNRQVIRPQYWRMFTLVTYNGKSWSQPSGSGRTVPLGQLSDDEWPNLPRNDMGRFSPRRFRWRHRSRPGYDVNVPFTNGQRTLHDFGGDQHYVRVVIESRAPNIGFIPQLPAVKSLREQRGNFNEASEENKTLRIRPDASIDMGVLQNSQQVHMLASVPGDMQYGMPGSPPLLASEKPNPSATLTPEEREMCLQLPDRLREPSSRLLKFTRDVLDGADPEDSDFSRAKRLAAAVESRGVYTLRPPAIPEGADAAEYFLLDNPRGYCTYFAGALTVVCRLAGIPARVVSGFVNPEWDSKSGSGILREANAHAWTEVWVPGWGWAPLDATPPGDRGNNSQGLWGSWQDFMHSSYVASREWINVHRWFLVLPLITMAAIIWLLIQKYGLPFFLQRWLASWQRENYRGNPHQACQTVFRSYHNMASRLTRRFRPRTRWETPREWIEAAIEAMRLERPEAFRELSALYERARYAPPLVENRAAARALILLGLLSWKRF